MTLPIFIDMGYESHYWVMLVVFGGAFLLVTVLYFLLFWLPKYLDKAEEGEKGRKITFFILTPIVGFLTLVGMIGGPALAANWSNIYMALTGNAGIGAIDNESSRIAAAEAGENIEVIEKEGAVLLRNENNCLPLKKNESNRVNLFGAGAFGMFYGNGGSGAVQTTYRDNSAVKNRDVVKLEEAMEEEGFEINPYLFNLVKNYFPVNAGSRDTSNSDRPSRTPYSVADSDNVIDCGVNTYAYAEIVRTCLPYNHEPDVSAYTASYPELGGQSLLDQAKEFSDTAIFAISRYGTEDSDMREEEIRLKTNEREVINLLKQNFDKVIILLNVSHAMEINELLDDGIGAILLIGTPGLTGNRAVAKILEGEYVPSGKLSDTWAKNSQSAPSFQSMGNYSTFSYKNSGEKFVEYTEGIYVGYRYYVTRAMTDSSFDYEDEVMYSFGEGKSYTTFEKWIAAHELNQTTGEGKITVSVKNTGDVAGKEVIELYNHAPYTGNIEKAWQSLLAFRKTNVIEPGETKTYEIPFKLRDMASWDSENGYYVLEEGEYEISLRDDVWHEAHSQGHSNIYKFNLPKIEYKTSYQTGYEYAKHFEEAELGPDTTPITYLSRDDWDGTWTSSSDLKNNVSLDSRHNEAINLGSKRYNDNTIDGDTPITGAKNGLTLRDLKDADWDDDRWEDLLDQLTVSDMENLVEHGGFQTAKIDNIGKAKATDYDGPAAAFHSGSGHPCGVIVASTWNIDAAILFGESIGKEGAAAGLTGWYAPGINIHRSPYGGRNFEYYSEDPLISGLMAGYTSQGTMEFGVYCYAKHMALNDQEKERVKVNTWASEQAIREIYLKPFELYSDLGGLGYMTSFNRIGSTWAGAHEGMLTEVVRNEWGFHGVVVTDYVNDHTYMGVAQGVRAQNDLYLDPKNTSTTAVSAYNAAPYDMLKLFRRSSKNILYVCAHSNNVWDSDDFAEVGIEKA
ncbi:MAG: glycoside hydrolase family 3 C-terminal domain-containing protein [Bacilli bacterium]|nr:glycoside hydrolase family 3 C-terminal domain-containing protein [Bacilli bacterium]